MKNWIVFTLALAIGAACFAQDAVPVVAVPVDEPVGWLMKIALAVSSLVGLILSKVLLGIGSGMAHSASQQAAVEALNVGVSKAYRDIVQVLKTAAVDGKLTQKEKSEAKAYAIKVAKEVASDQGAKFMDKVGLPALESMVEQIVAKRKA